MAKVEIKLKPCKCGSYHQIFFQARNGYYIRCSSCGYFTKSANTLDEAKLTWNRRADNG